MNRRRDLRLPVLAALCALVIATGTLIHSWPAANQASLAAYDAAAPAPAATLEQVFAQGVALLQAGQHARAALQFEHAVQIAPQLPEAHVNLGYARLGVGDAGGARDAFAHAIDLRPGQVNAYWGLAVSLEALCDFAGAIGAMRTFVHLTDDADPFARRAHAALWEWQSARSHAECTPRSARQNDMAGAG